MKYYRSHRKLNISDKKKIFRVVFVIAAALIIYVLAVLLGNHLKSKIDSLGEDKPVTHASTGLTSERRISEDSIYEGYSPTVFSSGVDVIGLSENGNIEETVSLIAEIYDTVTLNLTDTDGNLIYSSDAMHDVMKIKKDESNTVASTITEITAAAKQAGLRTCAMILPKMPDLTISAAAAIDSRLIKELSEMGFDEVLLDFSDYVNTSVSYESASRIRTYLAECSSLSDEACHIGILLPADVFLNASIAKQIQLIISSSSFVAMDLDLEGEFYTTEVYDKVSEMVVSLLGNFSVYNMRVVISSPYDLITSAAYSACAEHGIRNISFSTYVSPEFLDYLDSPDTEEKEDEPEEPEDKTNPYATTSTNPSIGADDLPDEPESDEPEEPEETQGTRPWF